MASILRQFYARECELSDQSVGWQFGGFGCSVALFPEGKCPFCGELIQSNGVWLARKAGVGWMLVKRWLVRDGRLVEDRWADHPHVSGREGGPVCLGETHRLDRATGKYVLPDSPWAALFFGINPSDTYWGRGRSPNAEWAEWMLRVWDHRCVRLSAFDPHTPNYPCDHHCARCCGANKCPLLWVGGQRGCLCGCPCHPAIGPCGCGHEACECAARTAVTALRAGYIADYHKCNSCGTDRSCRNGSCGECWLCSCGRHCSASCHQADVGLESATESACECGRMCCPDCEGSDTCEDGDCDICHLDEGCDCGYIHCAECDGTDGCPDGACDSCYPPDEECCEVCGNLVGECACE